MMLLRRWRRGRSSVSGVTVSLAASWDTPIRFCGREEQILPSLMQPSSSPAVRHFLLAGRDSPRGVGGGVVRCNADADAMCLRPPSMRSLCLAPTLLLQACFALIFEQ